MRKILLLLLLLPALVSLAQETTIYTHITLPNDSCRKQSTIRYLFYNDAKDSNEVLSHQCIDTLVINKVLLGYYYVDIYSGTLFSKRNIVHFTPEGKLLLQKTLAPEKVIQLQEVNVEKKRLFVESKGNKNSFYIAENESLNTGTLFESLQKLPGVTNGIGNTLTVNGKATSIYIDGLPSNFSGQDLNNYLNSITASNILKVEIINNPGAAYDASSGGSIINIITNKKNKKGFGGSLYNNTTFYLRSKNQSSITLNGLYKKISWQLNATYSDIKYENSNTISIFNTANSNQLNNYTFDDGRTQPLLLESSLTIPIKKRTSVSFKYTLSKENDRVNSRLNLDFDNLASVSSGKQLFDHQKQIVLFKTIHHFKNEKNTIALTYNGSFFNKNLNANTSTNNINTNSANNNHYNNEFGLLLHSLYLDFEYPTPYFKINTGGKTVISAVNSAGTYVDNNSNKNLIHFNYNDYSNAAYVELYKNVSKWDFTAGIRYQSISFHSKVNSVEVNRKTINGLFPNININYAASPIVDINASFTKKVDLPNYQDLNPNNVGLLNTNFVNQGNPLLNPSISYNYELRTTFFKAGYLSFNYSTTNLNNFAIAEYDQTTRAYVQRNAPFYHIRNWGGSFAMPFPLGIIRQGFAYANKITDINKINYLYPYFGIDFPFYDRGSNTRLNKGLYYLGVNSNIIISPTSTFGLNYQYVSSGNYMIYQLDRSYFKFDAFLTKRFFNNNFKVSIMALDLLKTATGIRGSFNGSAINFGLRTYSDTQRFQLSFNYLFGNNKLIKPSINNQDDKRTDKKSSLDFKP